MLLKVELVLDLSVLPGHLGDHVVSVWSLVDSSGEAFAPSMVVEVTFFGRKMPASLFESWREHSVLSRLFFLLHVEKLIA